LQNKELDKVLYILIFIFPYEAHEKERRRISSMFLVT